MQFRAINLSGADAGGSFAVGKRTGAQGSFKVGYGMSV